MADVMSEKKTEHFVHIAFGYTFDVCILDVVRQKVTPTWKQNLRPNLLHYVIATYINQLSIISASSDNMTYRASGNEDLEKVSL